MDLLYLSLSTAFFLLGFVLAVRSLRSGRQGVVHLNIWVAVSGLAFQSLFLRERGELHGRCPITNGAEVLVFVSWSVVLLYLLLGRAFRLSLLGVFSMPLVFVFQSIALGSLLASDPGARPPQVSDPWLEMHAALSLLAYGAFGLSAIAGVMYWFQNRQIKSHDPGRLFRSLPPIRYLIDAIFRLLSIGSVLLTVGIGAAFFMQNLPSALHFTASTAVWAVYVGLLAFHLARPLSPRRLAIAAIGAFAFAVVTLSLL